MARTGLVQDDRFRLHDTGPHHPERSERLAAIHAALASRELDRATQPIDVSAVDLEHVLRVHSLEYIQRLRHACAAGAPIIDVPDSTISRASFDSALLAAGAAVNAVDAVFRRDVENAFCAVRPPGHHAERHMSMGFCLFNNIAIAARRLLDDHKLSRVLILDWDVHHGNGTQHTFEADPRVLFVSIHGHPGIVYPGTGYEYERGVGPGEGFTINVPMLPPSSDAEYRRVFDEKVLPAAEQFAPEFVLISCGFDAHRLDPLAPLELETSSFAWMTDQVIDLARRHARGRIVSLLEGGYHLDALGECAALHVERLLAG
jgi:acetoin utilization deacetylase AcuC-like enzyme